MHRKPPESDVGIDGENRLDFSESLGTITERGVEISASKAEEGCQATITERIHYFDIWILSDSFEFDGAALGEAIRVTFDRRQTALPITTPVGLTSAFSEHPEKLAQWRAFVRKGKLKGGSVGLPEVVTRIHDFLMPLVSALSDGEVFAGHWRPNRGWES